MSSVSAFALTATTPPLERATLTVDSGNALNLALPAHGFDPKQPSFDHARDERDAQWLGTQLALLRAGLVDLRQVCDEAALREPELRRVGL